MNASLPEDRRLAPDVKGASLTLDAPAAGAVPDLGLNVLNEDVNFPVAVLRTSALEQNIRWMSDYVSRTDALFAPHGKTTMCPELFFMQLEAGGVGHNLGHQPSSGGRAKVRHQTHPDGKPADREAVDRLCLIRTQA